MPKPNFEKMRRVRVKKSKPEPKQRKNYKKADKATYNERLNYIITLQLRGLPANNIIKNVIEKQGWIIAEQQVRRYIKEAQEMIVCNSNIEYEYRRAEALLRLDDLFFQLYELQDYKGALQVQREINDLLGLKEPLQIEQNICTDRDFRELTPQEKKDRLRKLLNDN